MKRLIALAIGRPVGTLMFFLALIVVSIVAAAGLGVEFLPEVSIPKLIVAASYPGLPAAEVRVLLAIPLEDALSSAKGIKRIASVCCEGSATLTLDFHWGSDMRMAAVEVREIIDVAYPALPADTKKPLVLPVETDEEPVMIVGFFPREGDLGLARRLADREIKTALQQVPGVGTVTLVGGADDEIRVLADQERMSARGLSLEELSNAIGAANYDYPAGTIREGGIEYLVKAKGSVGSAAALGELPIARPDGHAPFTVGDVATIRVGPKDRVSAFCQDGREGVALELRRRAGVSPVQMSRAVTAELSRIRESYGKGIDVTVERDASRFIVESVDDLALAVVAGAAIAFVLLLFFMRDVRISLVMISSVPISILAALFLLKAAGRTLNVMSLGGLAMGLGMMVDHSVVVVENLQRRFRLEGRAVESESAILFTHELSSSNVGSTLTSIVVFIPILLLPGVLGALFADLSLAVIFSQVASFLTSISLVPLLFLFASRGGRAGAAAYRGFERFERSFRTVARFFFRKPLTLVWAIVALTAIGVLCCARLRFEFIPDVDSGEIDVTMTLRQGSAMDYAAAAALDASRRIAAVDGVARAYGICGGEDDDPYYHANPLESREVVHLKAILAARPRKSAFDLAADIRAVLSGLGAQSVVALPENPAARLLGSRRDRFELSVTGTDQAGAEARAQSLAERIRALAPSSSLSVLPSGLKSELRLSPDRAALARSRLDLDAVARAVKNALDGSCPTTVTSGGREVGVRVMLRADQRESASDIGEIAVKGAAGAAFRVGRLANADVFLERPVLMRIDRKDACEVSVGEEGADAQGIGDAVRRAAAGDADIRSLGESALAENIGPVIATLALVLLLLYLTLGSQFGSFGLPLVLLLCLPLSMSGLFGALFLAGKSINFDSILGIIVLFGVAVNNSVILYANYRKRGANASGGAPLASIYRGTSERLRAVVITMSATILSMLPVALDFSRRTTQSSMAVAIIGGLLVSTTLTLFVVPMAFYGYFRNRHGRA